MPPTWEARTCLKTTTTKCTGSVNPHCGKPPPPPPTPPSARTACKTESQAGRAQPWFALSKLWLCSSHLICLSLGLLICKMEAMVPSSQGRGEIQSALPLHRGLA